MDFDIVLGAILLILVMGYLILPWVLRARIAKLEAQLADLANEFEIFRGLSSVTTAKISDPSPWQVQASPAPAAKIADLKLPPTLTPVSHAIDSYTRSASITVTPEPIQRSPAKPAASGFEWQFGLRLPVWIGGIALALAGFYLVKYSIETGLLSPLVRIILGTVFGGALLGAAHIIRERSADDTTRITQSLTGAGISVLYGCAFAASNLYHLIAPVTAFAAMATITCAAVVLSLNYGAPIAVLGLLGGFLTPAMIGSSDSNTPLLFIYLYVVLSGLLVVIRRNNWWGLSLLTVGGAYVWAASWLLFFYDAADAVWVSLFILGISLNSILATARERSLTTRAPSNHPLVQFNYLTLAGGLFLLASIIAKTSFGALEFSLFGLLAAGSLYMAYRDNLHFKFAPYLSLIAAGLLLSMWDAPVNNFSFIVFIGFGLLYTIGGLALLRHSSNPVSGAVISGMSACGAFALAYLQLQGLPQAYNFSHAIGWALMAFALSAGFIILTLQALQNPVKNTDAQQKILAAFASTATAFLSLGLMIGTADQYWPLALSLQIAALCWLATQIEVKALRRLAGILTGLFALLMLPQAMTLCSLLMNSIFDATAPLTSVPLINQPALYLIIPALLFGIGSILLRHVRDDKMVAIFEAIAIALTALGVYYVIRHILTSTDVTLAVKPTFAQRGVITNLFFIGAVLCAVTGQRWKRPVLDKAGLIFTCVGLFRLVFFDLLFANPLATHDVIRGVVLFNTLLITYGLPIAWLTLLQPYMERRGWVKLRKTAGGIMIALLFALASLNVRFAFQGTFLDGSVTSTAEIYTYSIVWLLLGIGILLAGTATHNRALRMASLGIMILTIGKVFLYDASELTGLLRVFSFLGLGLTLLTLSWFYTRFVFTASSNSSSGD